ncbi:MAG: hypothetical protein M5U34_28135 [Chloroflexi bacterium]|nr:hypothetical protein [Chloroflexota bacterium]
MSNAMITRVKPRISPYLVLAIGIFAVSFGSILARLAQEQGVPSLVIAAYRTLVAALILLPFMISGRRDEVYALRPADWRLALLSGMALALHFATWISSVGVHLSHGVNCVGVHFAAVGGVGGALFPGRTLYPSLEDGYDAGFNRNAHYQRQHPGDNER